MIRPFTILFLADLHFGQREDSDSIIDNLERLIAERANLDPYRRPDFLVIAGDLIHAPSITKDTSVDMLYELALNCIRKLCKKLTISPQRVIVVPGNHDKCYNQQRDIKNVRIVNELKNDSDLNNIDWVAYSDNFKPFCQFYWKLISENGHNNDWKDYYTNRDYLGEPSSGIGLVSGLKAYPELRVCFLMINTEWTYYKGDQKSKKHDRYLIPSFLKEAFQEYKYKYPGYKLISIMHRNPFELSWNENYGSNGEDFLSYLYYVSDLILTGHQHSENENVPHMMANSAQLLNLGSPINGRGKNTVHRASLITVNPFEEKMTCETIFRKKDDNSWGVLYGPNTFNLKGKNHSLGFSVNAPDYKFASTFLRVFSKSKGKEDLEFSIKSLFPDDCNLLIVDGSTSKEEIIEFLNRRFRFKKYGTIIVAIYGFSYILDIEKKIVEAKESIMKSKSLFKDYLNRKLIFQTVLVYLPDYIPRDFK